MAWGGVQDTFSHLLFPRRVVGTRLRQVSWLPDHRLERAFPESPPVAHALSSPVTVAGPRRISTGFPIKDWVHLKRTTISIPHFRGTIGTTLKGRMPMSLHEELQKLAQGLSGKLEEKKGTYTLTVLLAERKAFLRKDRLEYIARFRIDASTKTLHFSEMLKEQGSGISADDGFQGFGFKKEVTHSTFGPRSGTIEEQSNLFGAKYEYRFDFGTIRKAFEDIAQKFGYTFKYHINPGGF